MLVEWILVSLVFLLVTILWKKWSHGGKKLPPGPTNWFGIGGILALRNAHPTYPHVGFANLAKKYGDTMHIQLGVNSTVVISNYEDMKELFAKHEFHGRYVFAYGYDRAFNKELGLLINSHENWRDVRKFSEKKLRHFGFKSSKIIKTIIIEELTDFKNSIKSKLDNEFEGIINVQHAFSLTVVNIIWNVVFGFRSKQCESLLARLISSNDDLMTVFSHGNINQVFPILRKIFPTWTGHNRHMEIFNNEKKIFLELIAESEKRHTDDEETFNYLHAFLQQIQKEKDNPHSNFTDEQLLITLLDLFLAGSETTTHFIEFAILHLVRNQKYQERIRAEIKSVVPDYETPTYDYVGSMPFTQAFMNEIFRFCNIVPIPLPRATVADYTHKGFFIPKGTCMMFNLHSVFFDPEYWGDPEVFRPERFLDSDTGKLVKTERMTAVFGFGKRICIGDVLAKQTAFAYVTGLVKAFSFHPVPGKELPSIIPKSSFTSKPQEFDTLVKSIIS